MAAPFNQQALSSHHPCQALFGQASFQVVDPRLALWASELSLLNAGPGTHPSSRGLLSSKEFSFYKWSFWIQYSYSQGTSEQRSS